MKIAKTRAKRPVADITNERFGSLMAKQFSHKDTTGNAFWVFQCDCGKTHTARANTIKHQTKKYQSLDPEIPSCGCVELARKTKHGYRKASNTHPLYKAYRGMMDRCYNENTYGYQWYGEIGVTVCDEWLNNPEGFIEWGLANGWVKGLHIDKDILSEQLNIHPHIYSPTTCQFVSAKVNVGFATNRDNYGKHPNIRLSHTDVEEILQLHAEGLNGVEISAKFNVGSAAIYNIFKGQE